MITAIDTSVLLLIARREGRWEKWSKALTKAAAEGPLVVCCVVFGEFASGYRSQEMAMECLHDLHIHYDPIQPNTARSAYEQYLEAMRSNDRLRQSLAYHLINAHSRLQANQLAVESRSDPRHHYSTTKLIRC
ncbi:MAG: PIN domain-containing protein [Verrucomicrobiota bacterium]